LSRGCGNDKIAAIVSISEKVILLFGEDLGVVFAETYDCIEIKFYYFLIVAFCWMV